MSTSNTAEIARILGEPEELINDMTDEFLRITQAGILMSVKIRRYRGFTKLSQVDMGFDMNSVESSLMELGSKRLQPKRYIRKLNSIDVTARNLLRSNGFSTQWGQFIPAARYHSLKMKLEQLKQEYEWVAEEIAEGWDVDKADILGQYAAQAALAYRRKSLLSTIALPDEEEFVDSYVERISAAMPTKEQVMAKFGFEIKLAFVPLSPTLEIDTTEVLASLEQRKVISGLREVEEMEQMQADVLEQARQEKEALMQDFMQQMMIQLRERTFLMVEDIKKSLQKNGKLHARSVEAIRNWKELMQEMNAYGDKDIEQMVNSLDQFTYMSSQRRDDYAWEIETTVMDVSNVVSRSLQDLGVRSIGGGRAADVQLPYVDDKQISYARNRLGIAGTAPAAPVIPDTISDIGIALEVNPAGGRGRITALNEREI